MAKGNGKGAADEITFRSMKFFVVIVNVITAFVGLALLIFGIYAFYRSELVLYSKAIPITMVITGALVFLVSFVGCLGAEMENKPMLMAYFSVLLVLVLAQAITTIYTFSNTDKVDESLEQAWQRAYKDRPKLIRRIEDEYSCCGYHNIYDHAVPDNCAANPYFGYEVSCFTQLLDAYRSNQTSIGIAGALIGIVQIIALLASMAMIHHLPPQDERDRRDRESYERLVASRTKRPDEYGSTSR
jgi:hypothetical protein